MTKYQLLHGDCLNKLKELEDNSVDAIVTDPPYGLSFMGKKWDYDVPSQEIWDECFRVLKQGGHLLSFSGSRTYHRMAVRIEDAGFEIRDQIMWIYGSGFPKSHNIGKAVDKKLGNDREVVGEMKAGKTALGQNSGWNSHNNITEIEITKGNSEWEGWGTALKPAHEPIVMARKPFKGSVADNVLEWGTGGINIDDSRISMSKNDTDMLNAKSSKNPTSNYKENSTKKYGDYAKDIPTPPHEQGRFPANVIFDEEAGKMLDEQNGDKGGASRFFYCAKANKKDRNEGLESFSDKERINYGGFHSDKGLIQNNRNPENRKPNKNNHPTVKPTNLMAYLIRLVTPKGGVVLDPFMGSGSTGKACAVEGMHFIGIEREQEYLDIAKARIQRAYNPTNPKLF
jgi:site-specific DNA-methyltransferase (adenine-specific)